MNQQERKSQIDKELATVSGQIRNDFDYCQCCFKADPKKGNFKHQICHIIPRRHRDFYAKRSNLLLMCMYCHTQFDTYKSNYMYFKNKGLFEYILNYLDTNGFHTRASKYRNLLNTDNNNDPREFKNGILVTKRTPGQNAEYWRNCIGQCVYWYKNNQISNKKPIRLTDKQLSDYFHTQFKKNVLYPIFGLRTTQKMNSEDWFEYVCECFIFLSGVIDVYEYGQLPDTRKNV